MNPQQTESDRILEAIERLRGDLARLEERLERLERGPATGESVAAPVGTTPTDDVDLETMMAIGAALAAYFGKEPRIRSIRLLRSDAWSQEGRTILQAWHGNRRSNR